jgi:hypothetical protein
MPREAGIDMPGLLQHVIVRGVERRKIFLDDQDCGMFVNRFSALLEETGTDCFCLGLAGRSSPRLGSDASVRGRTKVSYEKYRKND